MELHGKRHGIKPVLYIPRQGNHKIAQGIALGRISTKRINPEGV
jgi:hypothetical protein